MQVTVRAYTLADVPQMMKIWNEVVEAGDAFPQDTNLTLTEAEEFFKSQTYSAVAEDTVTHNIVGLYILHPNNIGRCGHICNASYAVSGSLRGHGIGRALVTDCLQQGLTHGFKVLQFNAVVATNTVARALYQSLGFTQLGVIPKGFRKNDGTYVDICPYCYDLT